METVIILPVLVMMFSFIWKFAVHSRDMLVLAENGFAAVRLLASPKYSSSAAENLLAVIDKQGTTKTHEPMKLALSVADGENCTCFRAVPREAPGGGIDDVAASHSGAVWTMLVGGRMCYPEIKWSDEPPERDEAGEYADHTFQVPAFNQPVVKARQSTYMLAKTASAYKTKENTAAFSQRFARHRVIRFDDTDSYERGRRILKCAEREWRVDDTYNRPYKNLPNPTLTGRNANSWEKLARSAERQNSSVIQNSSSCIGDAGTETKMWTRSTKLDYLAGDPP